METLSSVMYVALALALVIILFNGLTIVAIWRSRQLRTPTTLLILNMCISDFGVGVTIVYYGLLHIVPYMTVHIQDVPGFCLVALYMVHVMFLGSAVSVLLVGLERCLVIQYPLRYDVTVTKRRVAVTILLSWIVVLLQNTFVFWAPREPSGLCQSMTWISRGYVIGFFTGPLIFCIMVLTGLYAVIVSVAVKHNKNIIAEKESIGGLHLEPTPFKQVNDIGIYNQF